MAQVVGFLLPMRETLVEFLAPNSSLPKPWLLQVFVQVSQWMEEFSQCLYLFAFQIRKTNAF